MNPLGLSHDQESDSEFYAATEGFLDRFRENMDRIDAIPDGSTVTCDMPWCSGCPIERYR